MLIGLAGKARSGKDTTAQYLSHRLELPIYAFAKPLKDALRVMFDLTDAHLEGELKETPLPWLGKSPRQLMQTLGTEWGRQLVHHDLWRMLAERKLRHTYPAGMIVSDVRFANEAQWVRDNGGVVIHIVRPDAKTVNDHASEQQMVPMAEDKVIYNNGTLHDLYDKLDTLSTRLQTPSVVPPTPFNAPIQ